MRYSRKLFKFDSHKARGRIVAVSAVLLDHYNGRLIKRHDPFDVEHIYTLKNAWHDGFKDQYIYNPLLALKAMQAFANDKRNLIPVSPSSNRSRGSKGLWEYLPLNMAFIPEMNRIKRELAKDYNLKISEENLYAMDFADKALKAHSKGVNMGKVRKWFFKQGVPRSFMPF